MDLQRFHRQRRLRAGVAVAVGILAAGCSTPARPARARHTLISVGPEGSGVRMFRSAHHLVYTTFDDDRRLAAAIATLEASYSACVELTGFRPATDENEQIAFLFSRRAEWEAFTRSRAGAAAPLYLRLDRGGYTLGKACVVRDQGEHDTLTVLAHEQLHVFIATHFQARPPPFLEEGLAALLERVRSEGDQIRIDVGNSTSRSIRLAAVIDADGLMPLRQLLSMHAGNVVGLSGPEVDAFYSQAWAFARFLREGEGGRYRPALMRLLHDAATGALSSTSLADNPPLIERYLGEPLERVEPDYRRFAAKVAR